MIFLLIENQNKVNVQIRKMFAFVVVIIIINDEIDPNILLT